MTERLAREIFATYLKRESPVSAKAIKTYYQAMETIPKFAGYPDEVNFVKSLSKKIAQAVGVEEKTVWNAIVRSHWEGCDIADPEIANALDEYVKSGTAEFMTRSPQPKKAEVSAFARSLFDDEVTPPDNLVNANFTQESQRNAA